MNNNEKILEVKNLKQYFKIGSSYIKAVDDVSFDIYKGEVFGIVGESGCGKTTTGRSIIRLYEPSSGVVKFKGQIISSGVMDIKLNIKKTKRNKANALKSLDKNSPNYLEEKTNLLNKYNSELSQLETNLSNAKWDQKHGADKYVLDQINEIEEKYKELLNNSSSKEETLKLKAKKKEEINLAKKNKLMKKMQMIFQDPIASLDPRMTVHEIISEGLIIRGIKDKKYIDEKVKEVLELVGLLPEHATRYPHEFSGGQRQRIGIARAIIMEPELIIADEPISALDVSIQAQVMNLLNELREKMNLTIIFIAHNLSVVKYFSDRIAVMYFGKIVELATCEELFKNPLHPYTKALLSAIPLPDPRYEEKRKRIVYDPILAHDYSTDLPELKEITKGHFIHCNNQEFEAYKKELK